jgi:hypothetical protein
VTENPLGKMGIFESFKLFKRSSIPDFEHKQDFQEPKASTPYQAYSAKSKSFKLFERFEASAPITI